MTRILERTARFFVTGSEHMISQWVATVMIVVHWGLGIAILVGGIKRFALPTYQPLIDLSGGHIWLWGVHSIAAAILMMIPVRGPNIAGLWLAMVFMILWTVLFSVSLLSYPTSAATPAVVYGGFAMINASLLTARVIEKPQTRQG